MMRIIMKTKIPKMMNKEVKRIRNRIQKKKMTLKIALANHVYKILWKRFNNRIKKSKKLINYLLNK